MLKRTCFATLISLIALLAIVFSLASCTKKGDYPEIKSSKEEATVVATLGGHEVRYELFRAFFSTMYSGKTDGMTEEGWNAAVSDVMREIAYLYAALDVAEENGVDPEGDKIDDAVAELVRVQYEGGVTDDGLIVEGFETREKYKEALAAANLTDAVNRFIFRCDATKRELYEYLVENYSYGKNPGDLGDPRAFFDSDDCAHGIWVFVSNDYRGSRADGRAFAEGLREEIAAAGDADTVKKILRKTELSVSEIEHGIYVSKNRGDIPLDRALVADLFSLAPYTCGEIREDADGVWFAVGLPKDEADYVAASFFDLMLEETKIARPIAEKAAAYLAGVSYAAAFPTFSAETLGKLTVR